MKNKVIHLIFCSAFSRWVLLVLYTGLSLRSAVLAPSEIPGFFLQFNDKLMHAVQYFLLFFIAWNALRTVSWPYTKTGSFIYCLFISLISEWMQMAVDERYATLYDVVPGFAGALLGCLVLVLVSGRQKLIKGS